MQTLFLIFRRLTLLFLTAALLPSAAVRANPSPREDGDRDESPRVQQARLVHSSTLPSCTPAPTARVAPDDAAIDDLSSAGPGEPSVVVEPVDLAPRFARVASDRCPFSRAKSGASPEAGDHASRLPGAP